MSPVCGILKIQVLYNKLVKKRNIHINIVEIMDIYSKIVKKIN